MSRHFLLKTLVYASRKPLVNMILETKIAFQMNLKYKASTEQSLNRSLFSFISSFLNNLSKKKHCI